MRAAIYCRISQDKTGEAAGVTRQLEDCQAVASAAGWTITDIYTDNDVSATSGKPRPEYRRMLAAIVAGEVDAIVAWAPDRLYRRLADLEELIPLVEQHGTHIRTCRAGDFDLATPLGKMIARILGAVATGEVDVKSDRWKRSVRQRRESGAWSRGGKRAFGWDDDGALIDDEAETIVWLAGEVAKGATLTQLCRDLDDKGITTTQGNPWQAATLRNMLTNPRLAGHATLRGEIIGPGTWPAILEEDPWQVIRALLTARRSGTRNARVSLLNGMIYCGKCGELMVTGGRGGKNLPNLRTYRCQGIPGRNAGCGKVSAVAEHVEIVVETYARARLDDEETRARLTALLSTAGAVDLAAEISTLTARIVELEAQLAEPGLSAGAILRAIDRTRERLGECQQALAQAVPTAMPTRGGAWPTDLERRRRLVALVVERVTLQPATKRGVFDPDRIEIRGR